jgi:DNA phosphorothioation-associated putative methyltransferase
MLIGGENCNNFTYVDRAHLLQTIAQCPYGKRLPTAVYILRPHERDIPSDLWLTIKRAEVAARPDPTWILLKIHTDQFAVTFLSYPDFETDPHPALAEATKINLNTGSILRTDYRRRANPPILHRKEIFLPRDDPRVPVYAALTKREEEAELFRDPSRIGLRVQWLTLLKRLNLTHEGHELVQVRPLDEPTAPDVVRRDVARHRTAIKRYDLSKPVKQLLERGLLRKGDTFFDFGCGHGMDIEALQNLGYQASGWDPVFRPNAPKIPADVVNLGYVLNVIDEPRERIDTLREAYSLSKRLLLVATMIVGQESEAHSRPYRDGFLTKTNTFQKFYAPGELEDLIEQTLDVEVSTLGLGLCVVFRAADDAEQFEASRNRRRIDWTEINAQLRFSVPVAREQRNVDRYELNKELFEQFWQTLLALGRVPATGEFDRLTEVMKAAGGLKRALALVVSRGGEELWQKARNARTEDVLVYLAMTEFRKRFLKREIPLRIKNDIRSFFGDLPAAQARARELLFAAGDPGEIDLACEGLDFGWQDKDALVIHRSLLGGLPPILRIYVLCAAYRYGDPTQADLIKIHKHSGKVTFLIYDDFENKPLPELHQRVKVNLRTRWVEAFDHGDSGQLLYFKEKFLAPNHPHRAEMEAFSAKVRKLGITENMGFGPALTELRELRERHGLNEKLNRRRERKVNVITSG